VNLYHTEPEAPVPARGSPVSSVAPTVVPVAGNVVTAAENASLGGDDGTTTVKAMLTDPLRPFHPSTCTEYVVPPMTLNVTQENVLLPGQSSLLATRDRALTEAPVYTASSVSKLLPARVICRLKHQTARAGG
jgi:hypothetical protein